MKYFSLALLAFVVTFITNAEGRKSSKGRNRRRLQVIHSSDNESNFQSSNTLEEKVVNFAAVVEALRQVADSEDMASIHVTAGDHTIPGPFYQAAAEVADLGQPGLGDIKIYNAMYLDANGMGE